MNQVELSEFHLVGIEVRTSNANSEAMRDIPALWQRFDEEGVCDKIPGRVGDEVFALYTDYEGDHTQPYTLLIGCKVENLDAIPEGMRGISIPNTKFNKYPLKGKMPDVVVNKWGEIWETEKNRKYTYDFEVYRPTENLMEEADLDILIAV